MRSAVLRGLVAASTVAAITLGAAPVLGTVGAPVAQAATAPAAPAAAELRSAPETTPCSSSPFASRPKHKVWYRIPAIIMNADGDLLAFAEKRDNDKIDSGDFDVVMRKSVNGGRSWGVLKTVSEDGRSKVSNPVPILDPTTGDVLLLTTIRDSNDHYKGIYLQRSTDNGNSFSSKRRIDWRGGGATASGHGVVLTQGANAGRIIVPIGYRSGNNYGGCGMYSDDRGETWHRGYDDSSSKIAYIEGTITELSNGNLYISYRDKNSSNGKTIWSAVSTDGGASIPGGGFHLESALNIYSVKGSALSLTGSHSDELLYSSPTFNDPKGKSKRRDMGVYVSTDNGKTWHKNPYHVELESTPAAYSDLVQLNDSTVGLLYETGKAKWRERIDFRRIPITELTHTTKIRPSVKARLLSSSVGSSSRSKVVATVTVKGTGHPVGSITIKFANTKNGSFGTTTGKLTYTKKGRLLITLPKLRRGTYGISAIYRGTERIQKRTVSAGTLKVR